MDDPDTEMQQILARIRARTERVGFCAPSRVDHVREGRRGPMFGYDPVADAPVDADTPDEPIVYDPTFDDSQG